LDNYTELTTGSLPITLAETKEFIRVDNTADDLLIQMLLDSASEMAESYTNRLLYAREFQGLFDLNCFINNTYEFQIRRTPVNSISEFSTYLSGWIVSTDYSFKPTGTFPRIKLTSSLSVDADQPYQIKILFNAGEASLNNIAKLAILEMVSFWYENRGDTAPDKALKLPVEAEKLLRQLRIVNTFG